MLLRCRPLSCCTRVEWRGSVVDVTVDPSVLDIELALRSAPLEHWRELWAALADVETEHRHRVDAVGPIERVSNDCQDLPDGCCGGRWAAARRVLGFRSAGSRTAWCTPVGLAHQPRQHGGRRTELSGWPCKRTRYRLRRSVEVSHGGHASRPP